MERLIPKLTAKERRAITLATRLLITDYYFEVYFELVGDAEARTAFESLEFALEEATGQHRYSDYESFRQGRRRYALRVMRRRRPAKS